MSDAKTNILDLSRTALESHLESLGEKPYRARQLMKWIYHRNKTEFQAMSDLGKSLRAMLDSTHEVRLPSIADEPSATRRSQDVVRLITAK